MFTVRIFRKFISILFIVATLFSSVWAPGALAQSDDGLKRQINAESGRVSFIGPESGRALSASRALGTFARPQDPAMALAKRFAPEFGIKDAALELSEIKTSRPEDGRVIARYQQEYQGILVMGGELIVNTNERGDLYSMSGEVSPGLTLQTQPKIDSAQAAETALQALAKWYQKAPADFNVSEPELWIFDESLLKPSTRPAELVWRMEVIPKELGMPVRELVLVNAERGNISLHFNQVDTAWGSNRKEESKQVSSTSPETTKLNNVNVTPNFSTEQIPMFLGATWYVATTGNDTNSCTTTGSPCLTINGAIGKAADGDTILVAAGVYTSSSYMVVWIYKSVSLSGGWDSTFTTQSGISTIDGQNARRGIHASGGVSASLDRFIVKNGSSGGQYGGGVYNESGTLNITNSSIHNNAYGGINNSGTLTLNNSTISNNYIGGGIYNHGSLTLNNTTVSENSSSSSGGGIYNEFGSVSLNNTILSNNTAASSGSNCAGTLTSSGNNIIGNTSGCTVTAVTGDQFNVNPLLGSLLPTLGLHPLFPGSPAIGAGNPATCLSIDQRGVSRPQGSACDIGAFEYRGSGSTPAYILTDAGTPQYIQNGAAATSALKAVVLDAIGDTVPGASMIFTAPASGASAIFATTGTNTATVSTDSNGIATSPAFSANNIAGSYTIKATTAGVVGSADFQTANGSVIAQTYTANNATSLPGTLLCVQTNVNCTSGSNPHADAAHKYAIGTYELYISKHNRNSIDNNGMTIISTVHYDSFYSNAFWDGSQAVYGDGGGWPLADDVVAHELTHGVTESESNLFYFYQSGAINESFSDTWGEYYDQMNGQGNDSAGVKWQIGEDISGLGAIRSMSNPPDFGDPDRMTSSNYYTGDGDSGGVHYNSAINNKAVYLMVEGGSFNGKSVSALGWDKTGVIYYEVNTNLLTSGSDYSDLYYAVQQACEGLVGQFGITDGDCQQVKNALDAVEMSMSPNPTFNPDAPVCSAGQAPTSLFSDDFESGTGNWDILGSAQWYWQNFYASSSIHNMWGSDSYSSSDSMLTMKNGVYLAPSTTPYLHFKHAFSFEYSSSSNTYYDGGVLEYSTNNGATWVDATPLFSAGKNYTGMIDNTPGTSNALKGRAGFVGDSHGYVSSRYNLASLVGQTVKFRWRFATDQFMYDLGWVVDDVKLSNCIVDATAPTVLSSVRSTASPNLLNVKFIVTFSENVTGVNASDFGLTTTGVSGAAVSGVSGSGSIYTVTVNAGTGNGTIRLNVVDNDTVKDSVGNSLGGTGAGNGNFASGEIYIINRTVETYIGGNLVGAYNLNPSQSTRDSYVGVNAGPIKVLSMNANSLIGAERVIYKVNGVNTSFTEMMALPNSQLSTTYWLPWYNNVDLDTQLRFGNVSGSTATVRVYIGGVEMTSGGSPFTLLTGQSTRVSFTGVNSGPVKIVSDVSIVAAERVIYKVNGVNTSFSEMMALPNSQLSTTYWLPWYNNVDLDTQLRFGNVSGSTATVHVYIGGVEMAGSPFILTTSGAGQSMRVSFAGANNGPVQIVSDVPIVAAERVIYKVNGVNTSFSEMMALPNSQLNTTYWLPWYNNVDLDTQLRFGNVSGSTATVHVFIGGVEVTPVSGITLLSGQSTRVSYVGVNNGPVRIVSDQNIVAAERVIYTINSVPTSFSEMMALPNSLLNATYWLPWYNNVDLDTQLRFGVP